MQKHQRAREFPRRGPSRARDSPAAGRLARGPASRGPLQGAAAPACAAQRGPRIVGRAENPFSFSRGLVNSFLI